MSHGGDLDKPEADMTREELIHVITASEFLLERIRTLGGELYRDWESLTDAERRQQAQRVWAPALVNPWPASDAVIDYLSRLESA